MFIAFFFFLMTTNFLQKLCSTPDPANQVGSGRIRNKVRVKLQTLQRIQIFIYNCQFISYNYRITVITTYRYKYLCSIYKNEHY